MCSQVSVIPFKRWGSLSLSPVCGVCVGGEGRGLALSRLPCRGVGGGEVMVSSSSSPARSGPT